MSTKNKMNIIGYLGADPELRYTTSGRPVANLRIATTECWTDKAGTAQEHTEWHRVVAWGNLAEVSAKYLKKGSLVSVEGPIRSRKLTDKEGVERSAYEVIASEVLFLDRAERQKPEDAAPPGGRGGQPVLTRAQVRAPGDGGPPPVELPPQLMRHPDGNSARVHFLKPRNSRNPGAAATAPKRRNSDFGMNIIGYLGADPELRYTNSDWSVAKPPGRQHGALDRQGRDGPGAYRVASVGTTTPSEPCPGEGPRGTGALRPLSCPAVDAPP